MLCNTTRVRATGATLAIAAFLAVPFAATASAGQGAADRPLANDVAIGAPTTPRTTMPPDGGEQQASMCLFCWLVGDSEPEDLEEDLWQSECDDDGNCQSVPYESFMDPGPGAPHGPFGSGPRW